MKNNWFLLMVMICISWFGAYSNDISVIEGKTVFSTRCAACHNVNVRLVGPALAGVDTRHTLDWIVRFVHSSQTLVKNNDQQAVALFTEFNKTVMPDHPDLSKDQIQSVVEYIKAESKPVMKSEIQAFRPARRQPSYIPIAITNFWFFGCYLALVFLLAGCLVAAVKVKELQRNASNQSGKSAL